MLIFGIILGVFALIFAFQNLEAVSYQFLFWTVTAPGFLVFLLILAVGWILGWALSTFRKKKRKAKL